MRKCNNCGNDYDETIKGAIKKYCSKTCGRQNYYNNNKNREKENNAKWYLKNRDSEIDKNSEYRKQNKELFHWYHNKKRFSGMREVILNRDGSMCIACGSLEKIVIHHKDGTGETSRKNIEINNDIKNLVCLCPSCHTTLHHWQRRNKIELYDNEQIIKTLNKIK